MFINIMQTLIYCYSVFLFFLFFSIGMIVCKNLGKPLIIDELLAL